MTARLASVALLSLVAGGRTLSIRPQDAPKPSGSDLTELSRNVGDTRRALEALPTGMKSLPSVTVNGKKVPTDEVMRLALYMSGAASILAFQLDLASQDERERQKKAGIDVSGTQVSDAVVQERIELFRRNLETVQPDITWDQLLASRQQTQASYEWVTRVQLEFEATFLPKDTDKWPPATLEAAASLAGTDESKRVDMIEKAKETIKNAGTTPNPFVAFFTSQLIRRVADAIVLEDAMDGLPSDQALAFRGRAVRNSDLMAKGMGFGGFAETLRATQYAVIREAVRQDVVAREEADFEAAKADAKARRAAGETVEEPKRPVYWLEAGGEEFKAAFEAERAKYPTPPFDLRAIVGIRQFPTMQLYRTYFQLYESFRRATAKERSEKELLAHLEKNKLFFSSGSVDTQVIWYSYMADTSKGSYEEGFAGALARAQRGLDDVKKGAQLAEKARAEAKAAGKSAVEIEKAAADAARGYSFEDILDRDSDYRDPKQQPGQPTPPILTNRGRLGPQQRNPFSKSVHDSDLTTLLHGYSLGEELFFRAPVGKVVGPFRGALGYYVARVVNRTFGAKPTDIAVPTQRAMAEEDLLNHAFVDYVNAVLAKSKVEIVEG